MNDAATLYAGIWTVAIIVGIITGFTTFNNTYYDHHRNSWLEGLIAFAGTVLLLGMGATVTVWLFRALLYLFSL